MSEEIRGYFALKNKFNLERIRDNIKNTLEFKVMQYFSPDPNQPWIPLEQVQCHCIEDEDERKYQINIMKSYECQSLQNSKYIIVENDMAKLENQYQFLKKYDMEKTIDGFTDTISHSRGKLNLNYCPEQEIVKKRMVFLKFKSTFLAKLRLMQANYNN